MIVFLTVQCQKYAVLLFSRSGLAELDCFLSDFVRTGLLLRRGCRLLRPAFRSTTIHHTTTSPVEQTGVSLFFAKSYPFGVHTQAWVCTVFLLLQSVEEPALIPVSSLQDEISEIPRPFLWKFRSRQLNLVLSEISLKRGRVVNGIVAGVFLSHPDLLPSNKHSDPTMWYVFPMFKGSLPFCFVAIRKKTLTVGVKTPGRLKLFAQVHCESGSWYRLYHKNRAIVGNCGFRHYCDVFDVWWELNLKGFD